MTPLERAVDNGRSATVHYFVNTLGIDVTKFDKVILTHNFIFISKLQFIKRCDL